MVKRFVFAVPGDLATPTGGYAYDRRMIAELGDLGWQVDLLDLGEGFSVARRSDAHDRADKTAGDALPVALSSSMVWRSASCRKRRRSLPVAIRCWRWCIIRSRWSAGLSEKQADALRSSERAALSAVQGVIVTSAATARLVAADYGVPAERITIARPGSDPAPLAPGSRDGVVRLLSVGAVVPRKGFDVLIAALATLGDLPWQLTIAGDRTRDPECRRAA